jgi:anti-sigma-K factor RskA
MDTTIVILALVTRTTTIKPPPPARPVVVAVQTAQAGDKLTTCYESKSGSCWSE